MICPVSVYNKALEHRARLIDGAENKMKWHFSSFWPVCCLRWSHMTVFSEGLVRRGVASRRELGTPVLVQAAASDFEHPCCTVGWCLVSVKGRCCSSKALAGIYTTPADLYLSDRFTMHYIYNTFFCNSLQSLYFMSCSDLLKMRVCMKGNKRIINVTTFQFERAYHCMK